MKAFNFRLQRLLQLRETQEQQARNNFLALAGKLEAANAQLAWVAREINSTLSQLATTQAQGVKASELGVMVHYLEGLQALRRAQRTRVSELSQRLAQARQELLEATAKRKALESLRRRHYQRWQKAAAKAEQSFLDELAGMAHARRRMHP